jgi:hypothetical protein
MLSEGKFHRPASIVLTVGTRPYSSLSHGGDLDRLQGFAARLGNLMINAAPVTWLFGADPDFEWFDIPDSAAGRAGATIGNAGYLLGGVAGVARTGGVRVVEGSASRVARSLQGTGRHPGVDRFRDITLRKGSVLFSGFPGQSAFYTTASAMRRSGWSARSLFEGLQVAEHKTKGLRTRVAAYEVLEDTPAAFGLAIANGHAGHGWLPQVVVPAYRDVLRYLDDFPLGP